MQSIERETISSYREFVLLEVIWHTRYDLKMSHRKVLLALVSVLQLNKTFDKSCWNSNSFDCFLDEMDSDKSVAISRMIPILNRKNPFYFKQDV